MVTREVQDQVRPRGCSFWQSSMVRAFLDIEGVVVEKVFLHVGEELLGLGHLGSDVVCAALAPCVAGEGLRPEAEGALGRAAAGGIQRDVRVQKEGNTVFGDVEIAVVDLGGPGHLVELFGADLRAIGIVLVDAVGVLIAGAEDLVQRLAVGKLDDGEVELAADDEVDGLALVEGLIGRGGDGRADEADLDGGVGLLDLLGHALIAVPAHGAGEEDEELVVLQDLDDLLPLDVVGRSVQKA